MTNSMQEIIARSTSQVMSSMDQNYAMYEGQQQKSQVEESVPTSIAERSQLYPHLNQLPPIMSSSVYDFRIQASSTDPANVTVVEEVEATSMKALRLDEEIKNRIKQIIGESRLSLEGAQHNALQQAQNALQQAQHPSTTFQHLQAQLQKQQQQMQRTGTDVTVPGSISGTLPLPLPPSVAAARAAGDVLYPALPQPSMLATTPEAIAERRAAVAAAVAAVPERAAAAAAAAAKKSGLSAELQNMGLVKPGSPPPADSRTPPPTLASLAALHVEPPPPYMSNPSLAAYRNLLPQQPYSAHLANLMSGLSSSMGNPALQGVPGLSGLTGLPGLQGLQGLSGLPGLSGAMTGVTSSAAHTMASLSLPPQLPAGLAHLTQPPTNLQLPPMPSLPSALASTGLPSLSLPSSLAAPQPSVAPAWQNTPTMERENTTCHTGMCHASQAMAMIPMPVTMSIPMHMHPCCPSPWISSPPVIWMGNASCCTGNGTACPSGGNCCQTATGQIPSTGMPSFPLGYPTQRASFAMPNVPNGLAQTGPPGYRIPATLNNRSAATSTLNVQQPLPEKPKAFQ